MHRSRLLALSSLAFLVSSSASANLLVNATFESDLSGWSEGGSPRWSSLDAAGSVLSGSVEVGTAGAVGQCIPVSTPELQVEASVLVPEGQSQLVGTPGVKLLYYTAADCTLVPVIPGRSVVLAPLSTTGWEEIGDSITVPNGAVSAYVSLTFFYLLDGEAAPFVAYFDDVSVVPEPGVAALWALAGMFAASGRRQPGARR